MECSSTKESQNDVVERVKLKVKYPKSTSVRLTAIKRTGRPQVVLKLHLLFLPTGVLSAEHFFYFRFQVLKN